MKSRKLERKPLSFSTTMRNPERIVLFIENLKEFEGKILTKEIIMKIVEKLIKNKLYVPLYIKRIPHLKKIFENDTKSFSEKEIKGIIENSPQNHKEAGFEKGWDSRFDTWYKLSKEFGFIYYEMEKPIEISQTGHMLCDAYSGSENDNSGEKIQKIFLNALMKYNIDNPCRRNLNKNVPIPLLLNVLKKLKSDKEENGAGIFKKELPFLICWKNNDADKLYEYIKKFRKSYGYTASNEIVYEKCLELLENKNEKRFKMKQIIQESVDDLIRKLRITGIFSLRGIGRFVDINELEKNKIEYIIKNYSKCKTDKTEYEFYKYMGEMDLNIINIEDNINYETIETIKLVALKNFATKYENKEIIKELECLEKDRNSKNEFLKLIDNPTRLEFLTSLILTKNYPNLIIKPNYSIDDEGNPTFTAKGGIADIEVYDEKSDVLVEVTLIKNRQQSIIEIPAITRHLVELNEKSEKENIFSIFIAPNIHEDTKYMCEFTKYRKNLDIKPYTISNFAKKIKFEGSILEFLN